MKINNLVFEGGGIHGIAYLGVLNYLYERNIMNNIKRVAGTSAGAITACITSFNLPFTNIKEIADSLDYKKIPQRESIRDIDEVPTSSRVELDKLFEDAICVHRLINHYGWFSSEYFYQWIKKQIEMQFDTSMKSPPYTFADFKNPSIHKENRPFFDLYIIGTDVSYKTSKVFSYQTTPNMEVAEAVRISMSIPIFFEAVKTEDHSLTNDSTENIFSDGGVMRNYPINIFDYPRIGGRTVYRVNHQTLGARFKEHIKYSKINGFLDYIMNLLLCFSRIQQEVYKDSPQDIARSIDIDTGGVSAVNFNVTTGDDIYNFLYLEGYKAAENYFKDKELDVKL
ncbi:patatin-like phospholipase family protein [Clostridium sp.]|uniref:patatin-like phospholipase family protein n=1 Tax=Clostridium sp. TaxID=1506 RepID=UPI002FCA51A2